MPWRKLEKSQDKKLIDLRNVLGAKCNPQVCSCKPPQTQLPRHSGEEDIGGEPSEGPGDSESAGQGMLFSAANRTTS